ncbi:MAG: phosphoribosylglycinamide formyltransferase [Planctomycetes bacterium]|nr:phosphoribosylglycinamide formyltransferase [Planctomycetota bacterium]NOG53875.1 phosphoribosylglycinamide formyltransferase [Planctomycetota bacterium]
MPNKITLSPPDRTDEPIGIGIGDRSDTWFSGKPAPVNHPVQDRTNVSNPEPQALDTPVPARLAVLFSGGGRTLENLAEQCRDGRINGQVVLGIGSRSTCGGLERCERLGIESCVIRARDFDGNVERFGQAVFDRIRAAGVTLVCLAGYLTLLPIPHDYLGRVLNIHPALLPKFGGKGMYGDRVHQAVLDSGDSESGCTVHFADNEYDHGQIVHARRVPVLAGDTAETLAARVFAAECEAYPEAVNKVLGGCVTLAADD